MLVSYLRALILAVGQVACHQSDEQAQSMNFTFRIRS